MNVIEWLIKEVIFMGAFIRVGKSAVSVSKKGVKVVKPKKKKK